MHGRHTGRARSPICPQPGASGPALRVAFEQLLERLPHRFAAMLTVSQTTTPRTSSLEFHSLRTRPGGPNTLSPGPLDAEHGLTTPHELHDRQPLSAPQYPCPLCGLSAQALGGRLSQGCTTLAGNAGPMLFRYAPPGLHLGGAAPRTVAWPTVSCWAPSGSAQGTSRTPAARLCCGHLTRHAGAPAAGLAPVTFRRGVDASRPSAPAGVTSRQGD